MPRIASIVVLALFAIGCGETAAPITDAATDAADATVDAEVAIDAPACTGLSLMACRQTPGCTAEVCADCACGQRFNGCRADGAPDACPDITCPGGMPTCCRADGDCPVFCASPIDPPLCGICFEVASECDADAQCQPTDQLGPGGVRICEPVRCACSPANACVPGCVDDSTCRDAQVCDVPTGRCQPRACSAATPCPPDFDCTGAGCVRRTCTTDLACDNFCVEGFCRDALGVCALPPA